MKKQESYCIQSYRFTKYIFGVMLLLMGCKDAPIPAAASFTMVSTSSINEFQTGTRQAILTFTAVSTGRQQLRSLQFTFSVNSASSLSNFELSHAHATTKDWSLDPSYQRLTFAISDTLTSTPVTYILYADISPSAPTASFTVSLSTSGVVTTSGLVNKFEFANWLDLLPAAVRITSTPMKIDLTYGGTSDTIFTFSASTNGHQNLRSVNFKFSPNVSSSLTNFVLTDGNNVVGKASEYDAITNSITIYNLDEALSDVPKVYYLKCDVKAVVFPLSGYINLNPEQIQVSYGIVNSFATQSNEFTIIAPLLTSMYAIGGGAYTVPLQHGDVSDALIQVAAYSTGTQNLDAITFTFSADISKSLANFKLNGPVDSGTVTYNPTTFELTFSGMTSPVKTSSSGYTLFADVLDSAPASNITLSVLAKGVHVSPGIVYPFTGFGKLLDIW